MHTIHGRDAAARAIEVLTDWAEDTAYRWRGMQGDCDYVPAWSAEDDGWVLRTSQWSDYVRWTEVRAVPSEDWFAGLDWDADWAQDDAGWLMDACPIIRLEDVDVQSDTGAAGLSWVTIYIHGDGPWVLECEHMEWEYRTRVEVDTIDALIDVLEARDDYPEIEAGLSEALETRLMTDPDFYQEYVEWLYHNLRDWQSTGFSDDMIALLKRGMERYRVRRMARNPGHHRPEPA